MKCIYNPFPGPGGKRQVSSGGGQQPVWGRNGRELFYLTETQQTMMVVDITRNQNLSASQPRELLDLPRMSNIAPPERSVYDISPDGQRFLVVKEGGQESMVTQINVVLNWFEELKRLVPTDN